MQCHYLRVLVHKEVRDVMKGLQVYADPQSSFKVEHGKHLKITWDMINDDGEPVSVLGDN